MDVEEKDKDTPFMLDKTISEPIKLLQWCPTMDTIVLITSKNTILIQRLEITTKQSTWQRLCSIQTNETDITAVTWSPDGKIVSTAHSDGHIVLWLVESGKQTFSNYQSKFNSHSHPVQQLDWIQRNKDQKSLSNYKDFSTSFFSKNKYQTNRFSSNTSDNALDLLVMFDDSSVVSFSAFGRFSLGSLNLSQLLQSYDPKFKNALIHSTQHSQNLETLYLLISTNNTQAFVSVNTNLLSRCCPELQEVSKRFKEIQELHFQHLEILNKIKSEWTKVKSAFDKYLKPLEASSLKTHSSLEQQFLTVLISGQVQVNFQQYLQFDLKQKDLKDWSRIVEHAMETIKETIDEFNSSLEILIFKISELSGLSKWETKFGPIGLTVNLVESLLSQTGSLFLRLESFFSLVTLKKTSFTHFFTWLTKVALQTCDEKVIPFHNYDVQVISQLLQEGLRGDILAKYLEDEFLDKIIPTRTNKIPQNLSKIPLPKQQFTKGGKTNGGFFFENPQIPIPQILSKIEDSMNAIKVSVHDSMSKSFKVTDVITISQSQFQLPEKTIPPKIFEFCHFQKTEMQLPKQQKVAIRVDSTALAIISFSPSSGEGLSSSEWRIGGCCFNGEIIQFSFNSENQIVILLQGEETELLIVDTNELEFSSSPTLETSQKINGFECLAESAIMGRCLISSDIEPVGLWTSPKGVASVLTPSQRRIIVYDLDSLVEEGGDEDEEDETEQGEDQDEPVDQDEGQEDNGDVEMESE